MIVPLLASCDVNYPVLLRHLKHSSFGVCGGRAGVNKTRLLDHSTCFGGTSYTPVQNESDLCQSSCGASTSIMKVQMTSVNLRVSLLSSEHKPEKYLSPFSGQK